MTRPPVVNEHHPPPPTHVKYAALDSFGGSSYVAAVEFFYYMHKMNAGFSICFIKSLKNMKLRWRCLINISL